jgi:hypothetical protein
MGRMAWEWVAPVVGGIVGLAGIIAAYKSGSKQQETALRVVRDQVDGQVAVAREERQQRRLEAAYLELLSAITQVRYWIDTVYPLFMKAGQSPMPPTPELPEPAKKEALWAAY